jgi:hypothetical protein
VTRTQLTAAGVIGRPQAEAGVTSRYRDLTHSTGTLAAAGLKLSV